MTSITAYAGTTPLFTRLLLGLRKILAVAGSAGSPEAEQVSGLPPRLRYDVGLSDLCPDRLASAGASGDFGREFMRRAV